MNPMPFLKPRSLAVLIFLMLIPGIKAMPPVPIRGDHPLALWVLDQQDQWHSNSQARITSLLKTTGRPVIPVPKMKPAMALLKGYDTTPPKALFAKLPKTNQGLLVVRHTIKYVRKDDYYVTARLLIEFRLYNSRGKLKTIFSANAVADGLDNQRAEEKAWTQLNPKLLEKLKPL